MAKLMWLHRSPPPHLFHYWSVFKKKKHCSIIPPSNNVMLFAFLSHSWTIIKISEWTNMQRLWSQKVSIYPQKFWLRMNLLLRNPSVDSLIQLHTIEYNFSKIILESQSVRNQMFNRCCAVHGQQWFIATLTRLQHRLCIRSRVSLYIGCSCATPYNVNSEFDSIWS